MNDFDQLGAAEVAIQKLHKKLRQLRNRGEATDDDLADAQQAREAVRRIALRRGLEPTDIDSRAERKRDS